VLVSIILFSSVIFTGTYSNAGFNDLELDNFFGYAVQIRADYEMDTN
jgi:outer membrane protein